MDIENEGVPVSELVRHDYEEIHFTCRTCHRHVSKTPAELARRVGLEIGIWTFTRRLRCTECGQRDFTVRIGRPKGVPTDVY